MRGFRTRKIQCINYLHCQSVHFIGLVSLFFSVFLYSSVSSSCADSCGPFRLLFNFHFVPRFFLFLGSLFWCFIFKCLWFLLHLPQVFHCLCDNSSALLIFFMSNLASSNISHFGGFCFPLFDVCFFVHVSSYSSCSDLAEFLSFTSSARFFFRPPLQQFRPFWSTQIGTCLLTSFGTSTWRTHKMAEDPVWGEFFSVGMFAYWSQVAENVTKIGISRGHARALRRQMTKPKKHKLISSHFAEFVSWSHVV